MSYTHHRIPLSSGQLDTLSKAAASGTGVTLRLTNAQVRGNSGSAVPLTVTQVSRLRKASSGGRGAEISFSKTQLAAMKKGGFFPLFAAIVPALIAAGKAAALGASAAAGGAALKKVLGRGQKNGGRLRLGRS